MPAVSVSLLCSIASADGNFPIAGLSHYWTLNEASGSNRLDSIGSAPFFESGGNVVSTPGKHNNAALLNPVSTLTTSPTAISLLNPFSIAFWAKQTIGNDVDLQSADGKASIFLAAGTANAIITDDGGDTITAPATEGAFHFIVVTATNILTQLYVDHVLAGSDPTNSLTANSPLLLFGAVAGGIIDELMIFNRELTQSDIDTLWNSGSGVFL